jgi:hypothetical protein
MHKAYALRADYEGTIEQDGQQVPLFTGGTVAVGADGRAFDVRKALDEGNGVIVTADQDLITVLDHYLPLKPVPVPEDAPATDTRQASSLRDLREEAKRKGLAGGGKVNREALLAALDAHDAALAAGDQRAQASDANVVTVDPDGGGIILPESTTDQADAGQEN